MAACSTSNSATDARMASTSEASLTSRTDHSAGEQSPISPSRRRALSTSDAGSTSSSMPSGPSHVTSTAENPAPGRTSTTQDDSRASSM